MKSLFLLCGVFLLFSFAAVKTTSLEWTWIYETSWDQKADETNDQSVWVPTFSTRLSKLKEQEVTVSGYISVDAQGRYLLTQFRRTNVTHKDRSADPPDFIYLEGFKSDTYYAELKKYNVKGFLILNENGSEELPFALRMAEIVK